MVKDIEEFGANIEYASFGQHEAFDEREIGIHKIGARKRASIRRSELPMRSRSKATRVEILTQALVEATFWTTCLIRAVHRNKVVLEIYVGLIHAICDK